ncbi:MAG: hypothetical protein GXO54_01980 [Chloroflexi bacterium]|nr:hypothetical protein [Chloroflexota bacterium]
MSLWRWLLQTPWIERTRKNHALEHATIHVLSRQYPERFLAGHSDPKGFWLVGDVDTVAVEAAVHEALHRLRQGEHHLAVHPGCGTNYLALASMSALAGMLGFAGTRRWRERWERFPLVMFLSVLGLLMGRPLGYWLQASVTTDPDVRDLEVHKIWRAQRGRLPAHRVETGLREA